MRRRVTVTRRASTQARLDGELDERLTGKVPRISAENAAFGFEGGFDAW
jgi:hypothetical protein